MLHTGGMLSFQCCHTSGHARRDQNPAREGFRTGGDQAVRGHAGQQVRDQARHRAHVRLHRLGVHRRSPPRANISQAQEPCDATHEEAAVACPVGLVFYNLCVPIWVSIPCLHPLSSFWNCYPVGVDWMRGCVASSRRTPGFGGKPALHLALCTFEFPASISFASACVTTTSLCNIRIGTAVRKYLT